MTVKNPSYYEPRSAEMNENTAIVYSVMVISPTWRAEYYRFRYREQAEKFYNRVKFENICGRMPPKGGRKDAIQELTVQYPIRRPGKTKLRRLPEKERRRIRAQMKRSENRKMTIL